MSFKALRTVPGTQRACSVNTDVRISWLLPWRDQLPPESWPYFCLPISIQAVMSLLISSTALLPLDPTNLLPQSCNAPSCLLTLNLCLLPGRPFLPSLPDEPTGLCPGPAQTAPSSALPYPRDDLVALWVSRVCWASVYISTLWLLVWASLSFKQIIIKPHKNPTS